MKPRNADFAQLESNQWPHWTAGGEKNAEGILILEGAWFQIIGRDAISNDPFNLKILTFCDPADF